MNPVQCTSRLDGVAAETGRPAALSRKISGKMLGKPEPYLNVDRPIQRRGVFSSLALKR
jgi:hypothetical protein